MSKFDRQGAILRLVQERRLATQEEVAARPGQIGATPEHVELTVGQLGATLRQSGATERVPECAQEICRGAHTGWGMPYLRR